MSLSWFACVLDSSEILSKMGAKGQKAKPRPGDEGQQG